MKFVLHSSKEFFTFIRFWRIINRCRVNISNFLINHSLAGADVLNFFIKFVKIPCAKTRTVFHPITVQGITLMNIVLQNSSGPLAKLRASFGVDAVTDGDDGFQTVKSDRPVHISISLFLNYREILGS